MIVAGIVGSIVATGSDEVAVGAPFIAMHELFGTVVGFFASMLLWLLAGFVSLGVVNVFWPKIQRYRFVVWTIVGLTAAVLLGLATYLLKDWVIDSFSLELAGLLILAAGVLLVFMAIIKTWGEKLVNWAIDKVTKMDSRWKTVLRPLVILVVLVYMGPVLTPPTLPVFGITRKSIYWLTILAAPCFTIIWYPFYTFGWATIAERIL